MENKERIISGMRPTGSLHLGNFHGVLSTWLRLQKNYESLFFIADWHALTSNYNNTSSISRNVKEVLLDWLSVGIDPHKSLVFIQSMVPEHVELYLYLSMITPISWLERNPTYKDQINQNKNKDLSTHGFLGYPVMQAADILMYKANIVPVGLDQVPHIEIAREISRKFNSFYGKIFPEPIEMLTPSSKILGLDRRKMSKSYGNAIYLSDSSVSVREKVLKMITDPKREKKLDPGNPEICNVFNFHELYSDIRICDLVNEECRSAKIGCIDCKKIMADNLIKFMAPFVENRFHFKENDNNLLDIIVEGSKQARSIAKETLNQVKEAMKIKI